MSNPTIPAAVTSTSTISHSAMTMNGEDETFPLILARDFDELEGSLLPTAQLVMEGEEGGVDANNHRNKHNNAMAAVPIEVFRYNKETLAKEEEEEQQQQQLHQQPQAQCGRMGYAYAIPMTATTVVAADDQYTIRCAEKMGIIRSEQEKEAIQKANRRVFAHNYHEQVAVQAANEAAQRRDREGLQIQQHPPVQQQQQEKKLEKKDHPVNDDNKSRLNQSNSNIDKNGSNKDGTPKEGGGYQFRDYHMQDTYEPNEYHVKEYKSVYD